MSPQPVGDSAVNDYLKAVEQAAQDLTPIDRVELLEQIREHLVATQLTPGATESLVRTEIDRLGDPLEIVGGVESVAAAPTIAAAARRPSPWGPLEIMAVALLVIGAIMLPIIGPLAGLVCAWLSPAWTRGEKLVATALASGSIVLVGMVLFSSVTVF